MSLFWNLFSFFFVFVFVLRFSYLFEFILVCSSNERLGDKFSLSLTPAPTLCQWLAVSSPVLRCIIFRFAGKRTQISCLLLLFIWFLYRNTGYDNFDVVEGH